MNQKICIIQCPPVWTKTLPLSLIYLKTYLKSRNIDVHIIDLNIAVFQLFNLPLNTWLKLDYEFEEKLFELTESTYPCLFDSLYQQLKTYDLIGFSLLKRNTTFSFKLTQKLKHRFPDKKIVFGGPQTFFLDKSNKLDSNNYWVIGEGELPLEKIVNDSPQKIFRFEEITDLDTLPLFDYTSLNIKAYSTYLPLLSSRGCIYSCKFCSEKELYRKFRHHSPQHIINQIKYLITKYKLNTFVFCDSLINYRQSWLEQFCQLVIHEKLNIKWEAQMSINENITPDLAKLIKKSGCYNLFIGLESGCKPILKNMNKSFNLEYAPKFFALLKKAELQFELSLITGFPGETQEDFFQTCEFITKNKNLIPKIAQINPFVDYLNDFPAQQFPTEQTKQRVAALITLLTKEKIRYTKGFINNLIY